MKPHEATEIVMMLIKAFPANKADAKTATVYETMLADLDAVVARKAVARVIGLSKFFPTVAEIREAAADISLGPVRPGGEAWGDVLEQTRRVGYVGTPRFRDPIVATIIELWGWREMCLGGGPADRARFIQLYDRLASERRLDATSGVPVCRQLDSATAKRLKG